jgi:two-component system, OmpR family, sensor histidine kinase CpxA
MLNILRRYLTSISIKLFLWFWLVTIISILVTRLISTQFTDQGFVVPPHQGDLHRLQRMVHQYQNAQANSLSYFQHRNMRGEGSQLWLKDPSSQQIIGKPAQQSSDMANYIKTNNFTELVSVQFPISRLTGPIAVSFEHKTYQLYLTTQMKHPPFGRYIMTLPKWARLAIPLVISFLLCWLLAKTITRPLAKIQQATMQLGTGDLSSRVAKLDQRSDEFGQLASTFNQMAQQLELSVGAQQRLLGDMSHELRSPLTRLQLAIALAQKSSNQPDELIGYLNRCEQEVSKLDDMIGNVLHLARLENAQQQTQFTLLDLQRLMQTLIDDAQFLADTKHIQIQYHQAQKISIYADAHLLASALNNVMTNAIKYSPEHSVVQISGQIVAPWVQICVLDQGGGVPECELEHLFVPFFRVHTSRERSTGGTGLGLAIAKQAILLHGGQISASNDHPANVAPITPNISGLSVQIRLPLPQESS